MEAISNSRFSYLLDRVAGIIFLGTPSRGTNLATFAKYISFVGRKLMWGSHDKILKDLEQDSRNLFELRNNFTRWLNKSTVQINCVYESLQTQLSGYYGMVCLQIDLNIW